MEFRILIMEILGGRNVNNWNESAEEIAYNNWKNNRVSLTFGEVYSNILSVAIPGSYLHWVKYHNNDETRKFRNRLRYRYNTFKSIREIVLYLHENNYLAGRGVSPTMNEVEDMLIKDNLWYKFRTYTEEENKVLSNFLQDDNPSDLEDD